MTNVRRTVSYAFQKKIVAVNTGKGDQHKNHPRTQDIQERVLNILDKMKREVQTPKILHPESSRMKQMLGYVQELETLNSNCSDLYTEHNALKSWLHMLFHLDKQDILQGEAKNQVRLCLSSYNAAVTKLIPSDIEDLKPNNATNEFSSIDKGIFQNREVLLIGSGPLTDAWLLPTLMKNNIPTTLVTKHDYNNYQQGLNLSPDGCPIMEGERLRIVSNIEDYDQQTGIPIVIIAGSNAQNTRIADALNNHFKGQQLTIIVHQNGVDNSDVVDRESLSSQKFVVFESALFLGASTRKLDFGKKQSFMSGNHGVAIGSENANCKRTCEVVASYEKLGFESPMFSEDIRLSKALKTANNMLNFIVLYCGFTTYGEICADRKALHMVVNAVKEYHQIFDEYFIQYEKKNFPQNVQNLFADVFNYAARQLFSHVPTTKRKIDHHEPAEELLKPWVEYANKNGIDVPTLRELQIYVSLENEKLAHPSKL
ncbi:MAG: hypothetical protein HRT90_04560 [Candidatus Margulisbacteria bacterium]|nr:hypothetical protein [Candidatus Margulisiibacteriota bacterium]